MSELTHQSATPSDVRLYVCIQACIIIMQAYKCMHEYVYKYVYVCMHACMCVCMHVCVRARKYSYMYVCVCTCFIIRGEPRGGALPLMWPLSAWSDEDVPRASSKFSGEPSEFSRGPAQHHSSSARCGRMGGVSYSVHVPICIGGGLAPSLGVRKTFFADQIFQWPFSWKKFNFNAKNFWWPFLVIGRISSHFVCCLSGWHLIRNIHGPFLVENLYISQQEIPSWQLFFTQFVLSHVQ